MSEIDKIIQDGERNVAALVAACSSIDTLRGVDWAARKVLLSIMQECGDVAMGHHAVPLEVVQRHLEQDARILGALADRRAELEAAAGRN